MTIASSCTEIADDFSNDSTSPQTIVNASTLSYPNMYSAARGAAPLIRADITHFKRVARVRATPAVLGRRGATERSANHDHGHDHSHKHHHKHGRGCGHGRRIRDDEKPVVVWEWYWSCCFCAEHAGLSTEINDACPGCQHRRCTYCPMEAAKKKIVCYWYPLKNTRNLFWLTALQERTGYTTYILTCYHINLHVAN